MDLRQEVGQCFMVGYGPEGPDPELLEDLGSDSIGGVILFARNGEEASQMQAQIQRLREAASGYPLIALDQEGGPVLRVHRNAADLPAAMALTATQDPELVAEVGEACGRELLSLGADLNLAPVLDVHRVIENPGIGLRSFSPRTEEAAQYGLAFLRGFHRSGALSCGKHLPGKGAARKDAHLELPTVDIPFEELTSQDLPPFAEAISAGVSTLMSSHVIYPCLDPEKPVTTSSKALKKVVEALGFSGCVLSDDLEMGALKVDGSCPEEVAVEALAAGHHLLLVCHSRDLHRAMVERVVAAVQSGELPREVVAEAAKKVAELKERVRSLPRAPLSDWRERHDALLEKVYPRTMTLHRGELPLLAGAWTVWVPSLESLVGVEEDAVQGSVFRSEFQEAFPEARFRVYAPRAQELSEVSDEDLGGKQLFLSYNSHLFPAQAAFLDRLAKEADCLAHASLRNPFDHLKSPASIQVSAIGFRRRAQATLAKILAGELKPSGGFQLPEVGP